MAQEGKSVATESGGFADYSPVQFQAALSASGLNAAGLAQELQVTPAAVNRYANLRSGLQPATVKRMCDALGIHPSVVCAVPLESALLVHLRCWSGLTRTQAAQGMQLAGALYGVWEGRGDMSHERENGQKSFIHRSDWEMCRLAAKVFSCQVRQVTAALQRTRDATPWG
ncbi:helix-turn-helix transcriptional regulator [Streptomyces roseifaciens]